MLYTHQAEKSARDDCVSNGSMSGSLMSRTTMIDRFEYLLNGLPISARECGLRVISLDRPINWYVASRFTSDGTLRLSMVLQLIADSMPNFAMLLDFENGDNAPKSKGRCRSVIPFELYM